MVGKIQNVVKTTREERVEKKEGTKYKKKV